MSSVRNERRQVNGNAMLAEAMAAGQAALVAAVSQRLNELLIVAVASVPHSVPCISPSPPNAVATLRRDFRHTVAFYQLPNTYDRRFLRTTSRVPLGCERFNRTLRTQFRKANAFHSEQGLRAVVAQQVVLFNV